MSALPGRDFLERPHPGAEELACRFTVLLDLYAEMETASEAVMLLIEAAAPAGEVTERLKEKMSVADRILEESRRIAELKKSLAEQGGIGADDRALVTELEDRLTQAVNRMIEQENRGRELIMRRGVRVARR